LFLLWYIWKARNDNRFQRKTWTTNQIKLAAAAHINAHLDALQNPVSPPLQDISLYTNNTFAGTEQRSFQTTEPLLVSFPSSFAGTRCYTDAATLPDNNTSGTRQAGLGVFIINTDENPPTSIFIKALMQESSSVLMAESAALALAANLLNQIQCRRYTIFSDNQQLVQFLNKSNLSNPPDWRVKPTLKMQQICRRFIIHRCAGLKEAKTKWRILWQDRLFRQFDPIRFTMTTAVLILVMQMIVPFFG
jgi:ribonuclease HI